MVGAWHDGSGGMVEGWHGGSGGSASGRRSEGRGQQWQ